MCEFQSTNSIANFVCWNTTILLQTADAKIVNNKNYHYVAKVLLDSCSQQTYTSEKVVQRLNLMALQETNVGVKASSSEKEKVMKLTGYETCLQLLYDNRDTITIRALALPNICLPVGGQYINVAIEKKSLNLVDWGHSSNEEIDLLTCVDFYWKLVNGETEKIKEVGLFTIKSILGWLLKGQISKHDDIVANSVNLIQSSHELKV